MANTDDLEFQKMLKSFRKPQLQALLGFAGRNKNGHLNELLQRALDLLPLNSTPILMKIRELHKQRQYQAPDYQKEQCRAQEYPGYITEKDPFHSLNNQKGLPVHQDVKLKKLPFYELICELIKPSILMPVGRAKIQEQTFLFYFTPAQVKEIASNRDIGSGQTEYFVQVQLRFRLLETSCEQDDCFPPGVIVQVNKSPCPLPVPIPSNKQGVEPKRPPLPVDISKFVHMSSSAANTIRVSWTAESDRSYVTVINLVKKLTSAQLVQQLKIKGVRHADYTTGLIKEKLREDVDNEIATTSLRVSLLCPLGKMRISLPCRPTTCAHLQCFDAFLYIQMNERKPTWVCPVCNQAALYDNLVIDGYFQEVLSSSRLPNDANEIELHQDGTWSISEVMEPDSKNNNHNPPQAKNHMGPPVAAIVEVIDDDVENSRCDQNEVQMEEVIEKKLESPSSKIIDLTSDEDHIILTRQSATTPCKPQREGNVYSSTVPDIIVLDSPSPPSSPKTSN